MSESIPLISTSEPLRRQLEVSLQALLDAPVFNLAQSEKTALLQTRLQALTGWHQQQCIEYARILAGMHWSVDSDTLADMPYLAVRLFKHRLLASVPETERFKTLTSSGTESCPLPTRRRFPPSFTAHSPHWD